MPTHPLRLLRGPALALLPLLVVGGPVAARAPAPPDRTASDGDAVLAAARERSARADLALETLKHALSPGHVTDPMPDLDRAYGLDALRADYADLQRRAAGYRATLGDQHPTLVAAEGTLADLRAQMLDVARKALPTAEREVAEAHAAERRAASTTLATAPAARPAAADPVADVTGSVAPPARQSARPAAPERSTARTSDEAASARAPSPSRGSGLPKLLLVAALAAAVAAWSALRLLRRPRPAPRRVEPALAPDAPAAEKPPVAPRAVPADTLPILARFPLPAAAAALAVAGASGELAGAAGGLHATLRAAFGRADGRMTVLVAALDGLPGADLDAAALALAVAAAAGGRRPLLLEARAAGRLRTMLPAGASPMLVEAGGAARTLYRFGEGDGVVAVLPSDPSEAAAAFAASGQPGTPRLRGLDAFDTVVLLGDDAAALAGGVDLVLLAAPVGTAPSTLAAAAGPLRAAGRPCGALMVERAPASPAADAAAVPVRAAPRRRLAPEAVPAARLGLRGSFAPPRRRVGG